MNKKAFLGKSLGKKRKAFLGKSFGKKGDLESSGQMILWIVKILLFLMAAAIVLGPVGCHINRTIEDGVAESYIVMKKTVSCLEEKGFNSTELSNCMKQSKYGIKISNKDKEIVFNEEKYFERTFCNIDKRWFCRNETRQIGKEEFLIEVVVKSE